MWPNQQCQSTEGGWSVIRSSLNSTRPTTPCYNNTTCMQWNTREHKNIYSSNTVKWTQWDKGKSVWPVGAALSLSLEGLQLLSSPQIPTAHIMTILSFQLICPASKFTTNSNCTYHDHPVFSTNLPIIHHHTKMANHFSLRGWKSCSTITIYTASQKKLCQCHHHLIFTHQAKQQYQNRLYIDTMCEWVKRPQSGTNNNPTKNLKI